MKKSLKFQINLTRSGGELRLELTEFWNGVGGNPVEMHATTAGVNSDNVFRWDSGERALCTLLLRAFSEGDPTHAFLEGHLAASLKEVLRMKSAKGGGPTWIQRMFAEAPSLESALPLPPDLFSRPGKRVSLGQQWEGASFLVKLNGKPVPKSQYTELADELTQVTSCNALSLSVQVLVAPEFAHSVDEFRPLVNELLPVRKGQLLRIKVQLSQPAFLLLMWISPSGDVQPVYPGTPGQWPTAEQLKKAPRVPNLTLPDWSPEKPKKTWTFEGDAGMETVVAVARNKRITHEACKAIQNRMQLIPSIRKGDFLGTGPFDFDLSSITPSPDRILFDGPELNDAVAERHATIAHALAGRFDTGVAVSFVNVEPT